MIISLCGKSNSGKGSFAKMIMDLDENAIHVDIDKIAHKVNEKEEVIKLYEEAFSKSVIEDGKVNRKKLAKIVFNDQDAMKKLTDITWPLMELEIDNIIDNNKDSLIILDYILLPKTKYFKESDIRILIKARKDIRMVRACVRDGISIDEFNERDKNAINYVDSDFDYVFENNGSFGAIITLRKEAKKIYDKSTLSS